MTKKQQNTAVRDGTIKFFQSKGWTREQAIGIAANIHHESSWNPSIVGDGGRAYGLAQWHPDRQANFQRRFGKSIRGSSVQEQLEFIHYEMTEGAERRAGSRLRKARNAGEAAAIVTRFYERPAKIASESRKRASVAHQWAGTHLTDGDLGSASASTGAVTQAYKPTYEYTEVALPDMVTPYYANRDKTATFQSNINKYDGSTDAAIAAAKPKFTPYEKQAQLEHRVGAATFGQQRGTVDDLKDAQMAGDFYASYIRNADHNAQFRPKYELMDESYQASLAAAKQREADEKGVTYADKVGASISTSFSMELYREAGFDKVRTENLFQTGKMAKALQHMESLGVNIDDNAVDFMYKSGNEKDMQSRADYLIQRNQDMQTLSRGSQWGSLAAGLHAGAVDPFEIGVGLVTGGTGLAFKGATVTAKATRATMFSGIREAMPVLTSTAPMNVAKAARNSAMLGVPMDYAYSNWVGVDKDFDFWSSMTINAAVGGGVQLAGHSLAAIGDLRTAYGEERSGLWKSAEERAGADATPEQVAAEAQKISDEQATQAWATAVSSAKAPSNQRIVPDVFKTADVEGNVIRLDREAAENHWGDSFQATYDANLHENSVKWMESEGIKPEEIKEQPKWVKTFGWIMSTGFNLKDERNPTAQWYRHFVAGDPSSSTHVKPAVVVQQHMLERGFMGDAVPFANRSFDRWNAEVNGTTPANNTFKQFFGDMSARKQFESEVHRYMELKAHGYDDLANKMNQHVQVAGRKFQEQYHLAAKHGVESEITGFDAIRNSKMFESGTYSGKRTLDGEKFNTLSATDKRSYLKAMSDSMVNDLGFDRAFADDLAEKWTRRSIDQMYGILDTFTQGQVNVGSRAFREALTRHGLTNDEVDEMLKKYNRGGVSATKSRLDIDWFTQFKKEDGSTGTLFDMLDHSVTANFQRYSTMMAGQVSLARLGIKGKMDLEAMERAMTLGDNPISIKGMARVKALNQEILGTLQGVRSQGARNMNAFMNTVLLQQVAFPQAAEMANVLANLGIDATKHIVDLTPEVSRDIKAIKKGTYQADPVWKELEALSGVQGADSYYMRQAFDFYDNAELATRDSLGAVTRAIRAGSHYASVLRGSRLIDSFERRMTSGVLMHSVFDFVRNPKGKSIKGTLESFGFSDELMEAISKNIDDIAPLGADGKLSAVHLHNLPNHLAEEFAQGVVRGSNSIIQGTFRGESGMFVHNDYLNMLAALRKFSITAMEKNLMRPYKAQGAAGFVLGMSYSVGAGVLIHYARINANLLGKSESEQEKYLKYQLDPTNFATNVFNYMSRSGFMTDMVSTSSLLAEGTPLEYTESKGTTTVANFLPVLGAADRVMKALDTKSPQDISKVLPLTNMPYTVWMTNMMLQKD